MEQTKGMEFTSKKTVSRIDTDRSNISQGKCIEETLQSGNGERTLENCRGCQDSFGHGVGGLQSRDPGNISTCEGFGCNREATIEILVKAGELGIINLNLCEKCKLKFKQSIMKEESRLLRMSR
jgi:hypothetical protein